MENKLLQCHILFENIFESIPSNCNVHCENSVSLNQKNFFLIYGQRKNFFKLKKVLLIQKKIPLIQTNWFVYIKENFFESKKLSLIPKNCFLGVMFIL